MHHVRQPNPTRCKAGVICWGSILNHPSPSPGRSHWGALGLLFVGTIFVSLITTFASLAYQGGATPMLLVWSRFTALMIVLGLILKAARVSFKLPKRNMRATLWIALCLMAMSVGYLSSVAYIKVSLAVILLYTYPLLVAVFAALSGRERISPLRALLLVTAFLGLVIALGQDIGLQLDLGGIAFDAGQMTLDWRGAAFALIASLGVAAFVTWGGAYLDDVDSRVVNFWAQLWMIGLATVYVTIVGGVFLPETGLGWLGYLGGDRLLCHRHDLLVRLDEDPVADRNRHDPQPGTGHQPGGGDPGPGRSDLAAAVDRYAHPVDIHHLFERHRPSQKMRIG